MCVYGRVHCHQNKHMQMHANYEQERRIQNRREALSDDIRAFALMPEIKIELTRELEEANAEHKMYRCHGYRVEEFNL